MPRVPRTEAQERRVSSQARAASEYRAERKVQMAQEEIATVGAAIPDGLDVTLSDYDTLLAEYGTRISALESP